MRSKVSLLIVIVIVVGLASRSTFALQYISVGVGDALYGMLMYFLIRWFFIHKAAVHVFWLALLACTLVEFSQLITVDWFETLRNTSLGKLILGNNFRIFDLLYLSLGVGGGLVIDKVGLRPK